MHQEAGISVKCCLVRQHRPRVRQPFSRVAHTRTGRPENTKCYYRSNITPYYQEPTDRVHRGVFHVAPSHSRSVAATRPYAHTCVIKDSYVDVHTNTENVCRTGQAKTELRECVNSDIFALLTEKAYRFSKDLSPVNSYQQPCHAESTS